MVSVYLVVIGTWQNRRNYIIVVKLAASVLLASHKGR